MGKPIYIVFTGGCHSGKTTSIKVIKKILEKHKKKVYVFSEIIRDHNIGSIDEIRKDADKYMDLQEKIISEKIEMELSLTTPEYEDDRNEFNSVVLVDRAITDSLFYLTFYTNKNGLSEESQEKFFNTFNKIENHLKGIIGNVYNYIFEFKPLDNINEEDSFRPSNLSKMKDIEYKMIHNYNKLYFGGYSDYREIDLNNVSLDKLEEYWENYLIKNTGLDIK